METKRMRKGWFKIAGVQDGDRTLGEQLKGLNPLLRDIRGTRVLDLGCAEGLIADACIARGAEAAYGVEINQASVRVGQTMVDRMVFISHLDLNRTDLVVEYLRTLPKLDVCLMLAILVRLRRPLELIDAVVKEQGPALFVVRLPSFMPGFVKDHRSGNIRFDVTARFNTHGYDLSEVEPGHYEEWTGYYRKR
jgi:SAM-dependent methyltransferase